MDVLDAQRGYFDAQIGVSNAIRDELIAMVNVYKALGGRLANRMTISVFIYPVIKKQGVLLQYPLLLSIVKNINIFWSCNRLFCRDCRH